MIVGELVDRLEEAHDAAPVEGECPVEGCGECLKCLIMELIWHLEDPEVAPHPGPVWVVVEELEGDGSGG